MLWRGLGRGARCQRLASLLSQSPPSQTVFRRALSSTPTASASPLGARDILRGRLNVALEQLFRKHYPLEDVDVSHYDGIVFPTPKPEKFGDYQCNVCMPLAKRLKVKPRDVATQLVSLLQVEDIVASTTIAGPGFLNFRVSEGFVKSKLGALLGDSSERLGYDKSLFLQQYLAVFSLYLSCHLASFVSACLPVCLSACMCMCVYVCLYLLQSRQDIISASNCAGLLVAQYRQRNARGASALDNYWSLLEQSAGVLRS